MSLIPWLLAIISMNLIISDQPVQIYIRAKALHLLSIVVIGVDFEKLDYQIRYIFNRDCHPYRLIHFELGFIIVAKLKVGLRTIVSDAIFDIRNLWIGMERLKII